MANMETNCVRCSQCGKRVSSSFYPIGEFVIRAWIECPECIEKQGKSTQTSEVEGIPQEKLIDGEK